jgi:ribosomal protein S18 acetylase RimI-like enzyme
MAHPEIRPVTPSDIPALLAFLRALAAEDKGAIASTVESLSEAFANTLLHALIAPHGMVIYYPDYSTHRGEPGLYIQDLYVAPEGRGTGLAHALVAATLTHQTWGARYITLGVSPDNSQALRFYRKTGFTLRGYEMMIRDGATLPDLP